MSSKKKNNKSNQTDIYFATLMVGALPVFVQMMESIRDSLKSSYLHEADENFQPYATFRDNWDDCTSNLILPMRQIEKQEDLYRSCAALDMSGCIIVFLPGMAVCNIHCQQAYIMRFSCDHIRIDLTTVGRLWSQIGQQPYLETALGINQSDKAIVAVANFHKSRVWKHEEAWTRAETWFHDINEFLIDAFFETVSGDLIKDDSHSVISGLPKILDVVVMSRLIPFMITCLTVAITFSVLKTTTPPKKAP